MTIAVSNADRVVFPEIGATKGQVVAYYEAIAHRLLPHVVDRPLSIRRYPKGLAGAGFFQKNVPSHYPASMARFAVPRSPEAARKHARRAADTPVDVTIYPVVREAEHLPYLANQGAIELHVPTARVVDDFRPDRIVIDLDPPAGAVALVRRAARLVREELHVSGLASVPVATGSKGYHVVAPIVPVAEALTIAAATQKLGALLAARHPDVFTIAFRTANRGKRVFVDWLRNNPGATVIAPYSLRARATAPVASPVAWEELDVLAPDAFRISEADRLLERPDALADLAARPQDPGPFVAAIDDAFDRSGIVLEAFDRFRA